MIGFRLLATAVALLMGVSSCDSGSNPESPGRTATEIPKVDGLPNVLVVVTDDQRLGGWTVLPSVTEIFRKQGTTFARAFATTPLCCPARASIFTGRYAHNHHIRSNVHPERVDQTSTLQHYLNQAGYATAVVGKYFNRWPLEVDPPSFDRWAIYTTLSEHRGGYYGRNFNIDGTLGPVATYSTTFLGHRSIDLLEEFDTADDDQPWFLYVGTEAPHRPFTPEPAYRNAPVPPWEEAASLRENDRSDKPPWVAAAQLSRREATQIRSAQLRALMSVDDLVSRLFAGLRRLGEDRRTMAFFLSDNGFYWGDHGLSGKNLPYSGAVRVPLLMRWPGRIPAGEVDTRLAANVDVLPTVLEAAGISPDQAFPVDGKSLVDSRGRTRILLENWARVADGLPGWASVWEPARQYIEWYSGDRRDPIFREYYNLNRDPGQRHNLLGDASGQNDPSTKVLQQLHRTLRRDQVCEGSSCP